MNAEVIWVSCTGPSGLPLCHSSPIGSGSCTLKTLLVVAAAAQEPELLEEVLKAQGGHEGLASLRFKEALVTAAAAKAASSAGGTVGVRSSIRSLDLMQSDVLKLIDRSADSWGQVCCLTVLGHAMVQSCVRDLRLVTESQDPGKYCKMAEWQHACSLAPFQLKSRVL